MLRTKKSIWAAAWRGDKPISVGIEPAAATDQPDHLTVSGADGGVSSVEAARIAEFFEFHHEALFITLDAVALFEFVTKRCEKTARPNPLWRVLDQGRLIDLTLLEQRVRVADAGVHPKPHTPADLLALAHDGDGSEGRCSVQDLPLIHRKLVKQAIRPTNPHDLTENPTRKPLGMDLDVQGAIALAAITSSGIQLNADLLPRIKKAAEAAFAEAAKIIHKEKSLRPGFEWCSDERERILRNQAGYPDVRKSALRDCLKALAKRSADYSAAGRLPPLDDAGKISVVPAHWRQWCHPAIGAWLNLDASAAVLRVVSARTTVNLRFAVLPRILPINVDFKGFRFASKPFRARKGFSFIIATLESFELRCFARVLDRYFPSGAHAGDLYRRREDLVEDTAIILWTAEQKPLRREALSSYDFHELTHIERLKWMSIAKVLLQSVARCYSEQEIRWAMRAAMPSEDFGESFIQKLLGSLRHEINYYLDEDRILSHIAKRSKRTLTEVIAEHLDNDHPETIPRAARNDLARRGLSELLLQSPRSETGRLSCPTPLTQVPAAECRELEDEIRASVLYQLVQAGWCVVGFDGDDFVIEVPADRADRGALERIQLICSQAVARVTDGSIFDSWGVTLADAW